MALNDWRHRLQACGDPQLAEALESSIETLFHANLHALTVDAAERNIAHRLAVHLGGQKLMAPDGLPWDVDVEYTRHGVKVKTIYGEQVVVPDLIVHRIGTDLNYLALELKKGAGQNVDEADLYKLWAYRQPDQLNYRHALFMRLGTGDAAGTVSCVRWA
jgi:hypothetical protein